MPWKQTDVRRVVRPCCGAAVPVDLLWPGSTLLRHRIGCRYAR